MAVRAGRPSSGSGGLEAYAIPILAVIAITWIVRRFGPLLAARISRLLVGEEAPLEFANKGKLKGKSKRVIKAAPASAQLRSPSKKPTGSPSTGAASTAAPEAAAPAAASKATGPASYQELVVAPLAAVNDREAQATAAARNDSVEWTVNESKKPKGGGSKLAPTSTPHSKERSLPSPPSPPPEPRYLRFEFEEGALRRIAHGLVTHEARVEAGDWKGISAGDYFVAHSAMREVTIEVVGLSRYPSFGAAWSALGPKLLPAKLGLKTAQHADEYYAQRFPRAILAMGVIAFELQVIFCEDLGGGPPLVGGAGGSSSSSADACMPAPSASPQQPENGTSSSGKGKARAPPEPPLEARAGEGPAPGNANGKQPYRRPGKGPTDPGRGNGKAPAGKAPARESE